MKVIVREKVNAIATPEIKTFNITVDAIKRDAIPGSIGLMKGDLIIFRGNGDPVRFPSGGVNGKILVTDNTTETGWALETNGSGSGNGVLLTNVTGDIVETGTVVKIQSDLEFIKATSADELLFVVSEDCAAGEDVLCYNQANTVCSILCTSDAVSVNDKLAVSSTDGLAESTAGDGFAIALSAKASGSTGLVDAILIQNGFLPLTGGTLTGDVKVEGKITVEKGSGAQIVLSNADGNTSSIQAKKPSSGTNGSVLLVNAGGNAVIGAGEFAGNAYSNNVENCQDEGERLLLGSDGDLFLMSNANTIANRKTWKFDTTGATTLPSALTVANGGTGATTVAGARNALGLGNTSGAVPVANGGTGASNASSARTNLGFSMSVTNKYDYADVSLANNTDTELGTFSLTAGTYILRIGASFASNNAGYRQIHLYNKTDSTDVGYIWDTQMRATDGGRTTFGITGIIQISSTKTYAIKGKQNSGSTIAVSPRYTYLKII